MGYMSLSKGVHILGKTEKIFSIVDKGIPSSLDHHQMENIDEWGLCNKPKIPLVACTSVLISKSDKANISFSSQAQLIPPTPDLLYISISQILDFILHSEWQTCKRFWRGKSEKLEKECVDELQAKWRREN
ncbi:hypothetical protein GBA52_015885 [Prunus armeniaca]|nr:hypothetical protein GBA52_015885 [Prunus armeniaca]